MRKHLIRTTLIATILATSLAFTACGKDDKKTNNEPKNTTKVEASDGELETTLEEDETSSNEIATTNEKETTTMEETTTIQETTTMETTTIVETTTPAPTTQAPQETQEVPKETPAPTEPVTEPMTEAPTQAPQETPAPTEAPTQPPTEAPTQPQTEAPVVEESPEVKKIKSLHIAKQLKAAETPGWFTVQEGVGYEWIDNPDYVFTVDREYIIDKGHDGRGCIGKMCGAFEGDENCQAHAKCPYKFYEWTTRRFRESIPEKTLGFYHTNVNTDEEKAKYYAMIDLVMDIYAGPNQNEAIYTSEVIGWYEGEEVSFTYFFLNKFEYDL